MKKKNILKVVAGSTLLSLGISFSAYAAEKPNQPQEIVSTDSVGGWVTAENGRKHYYDAAGEVKGEKQIDGKWYYFAPETGEMAIGWTEYGGHTYYYDTKGQRVSGILKIDNVRYYFDKFTGALKSEWVTEKRKKHYYDTTGEAKGEKQINGKWYYFNEKGEMQTGFVNQENKTAYYNVDGTMCYGEKYIGGSRYYFAPETGAMATGWTEHDGHTYYYDSKGRKLCGWNQIENEWKYFDDTTGIYDAQWERTGDAYYYIADGKHAVGEKVIDGNSYYFDADKDGAMATGWTAYGGHTYYYDSKGHKLYGWNQIENEWKYFDDTTGIYDAQWERAEDAYYYIVDGKRCTGEQSINGQRYYFDADKDGAMATGWVSRGGYTYYYDAKGRMVYGMQEIEGAAYYFHPSTGVMQTGWVTVSGDKYYFHADGKMAKNTKIDGMEIGSDGKVSDLAYTYAANTLNKVGRNLKAAFQWSASMKYKKDSIDPSRGSEAFARDGFRTGEGNCYGMAATFYCMAKVLGYDAHQVSGYVPLRGGGIGPHSWVEIKINGTTYVFDPDFTNETRKNGYQISYGASGTWRYSNYRRMN